MTRILPVQDHPDAGSVGSAGNLQAADPAQWTVRLRRPPARQAA